MGIIPKVSCRRCHREFSATRKKCPYCGTRRVTEPTRTAATSASTVRGTSANARANQNARYQMIFGGVIMCAVIIAVIVLISVSLGGNSDKGGDSSAVVVSPSADLITSPTPTLPPTASPEPTVLVTSITFTYSGAPLAYENQFATSVGNTTKLGVSVYPLNTGAKVVWTSSDDSVVSIETAELTVDDSVTLTALKSGWATIYAECGGFKASCDVWVQ